MIGLGRTPAFRAPQGEVLPGSISEIIRLRLGGVNQWVMIRGECVFRRDPGTDSGRIRALIPL
jgi:hypothetical protein